MTTDEAKRLVGIYGEAWVNQDTELVLTIFDSDTTYTNPDESINYGYEGIKKYWNDKVIEEQRNINFKILNIWVDGDTVIAEWDADFIDIKINMKVVLTEVAIFTIKDDKFTSVRGYYKTNKIPL